MTELFDNVAWVSDNHNKLTPISPKETFAYVVLHHPLSGLVAPKPALDAALRSARGMSVSELARYADAVTVCCCEALGTSEMNDAESNGTDVGDANITSLGGLAYISEHHSQQAVRDWARQTILRWQTTQSTICVIM